MYNKYLPKLRSYTSLLVSQALWYYSIVTHRKCVAKHMINLQIGVRPSRLHHSLVHHVYNKYIPKLRSYTSLLVSQAYCYYSIVTHRKCIAKHMINHSISADWCTTKPIELFSFTPRVQQVHSKAEVIHLTPGHPGLLVLFNRYA